VASRGAKWLFMFTWACKRCRKSACHLVKLWQSRDISTLPGVEPNVTTTHSDIANDGSPLPAAGGLAETKVRTRNHDWIPDQIDALIAASYSLF
jgi:hypothetical protein